jgi:hypothetical protein
VSLLQIEQQVAHAIKNGTAAERSELKRLLESLTQTL